MKILPFKCKKSHHELPVEKAEQAEIYQMIKKRRGNSKWFSTEEVLKSIGMLESKK